MMSSGRLSFSYFKRESIVGGFKRRLGNYSNLIEQEFDSIRTSRARLGLESLENSLFTHAHGGWLEAIGRTFYVLYWLYLADLGQTSVIYSDTFLLDLTNPLHSDTTYNLFVNETLFQNYAAYLDSRNGWTDQLSNVTFKPLQPVDTMFLQSYSCQQRQLKSTFNFLTSVITADYVLIVGPYYLIMLVAGAIQKRRKMVICPQCLNVLRYSELLSRLSGGNDHCGRDSIRKT